MAAVNPIRRKGRMGVKSPWLADRLAFGSKKLPSGCIIWTGNITSGGYGCLVFSGVRMQAHRASYQEFIGPLPPGVWALHHCDNRPCINPAHLYAGTAKDNTRDALTRGRSAFGDRNGARLYPHKLARGSRNGAAKLTDEMVREARRLFSLGLNKADIGRIMGVDRTSIRRAVTGELWRHVR